MSSKMKVMVVGSGGREAALAWYLFSDPDVKSVVVCPGNAGIFRYARCVPIAADDISGLLALAKKEQIDLTVVGPEVPLGLGIGDIFRQEGLRIFGPSGLAAEIEMSKAFCAGLLLKNLIPVPESWICDNPDSARKEAAWFLRRFGSVVIKADGPALGKGVVVAHDLDMVLKTIEAFMVEKIHGESGSQVVIQKRVTGREVSVIALTDGKDILLAGEAEDYKPVLDGDKGPNTGSMGSTSPVPALTPELLEEIVSRIFRPTIQALANDGRPYQGALYAGLMLTDKGPVVLEFNARFGDPETQVMLPRLESSFSELLLATTEQGTLRKIKPRWSSDAAVCVVLASGGYPGAYEKGFPISGIERAELCGAKVFHAGTAASPDSGFLTNGGRVLNVVGWGATLAAAQAKAYEAAEFIKFEGMQFRRDIGYRSIS